MLRHDIIETGVACKQAPITLSHDQPAEQTRPPTGTGTRAHVSDFPTKWTHSQLAELQQKDPAIGVVYEWLQQEIQPTRNMVLSYSPEVKSYVSQLASMLIIDDVTYRRFEKPNGDVLHYQLVAPRAIRDELLGLIHEKAASHLAARKTIDQVQRQAYWFKWRTDVEGFYRRCEICNQYCKGKAPRQGLLQDMRTGYPFERLQIDLTGRHPTSNRFVCLHGSVQFHEVCYCLANQR